MPVQNDKLALGTLRLKYTAYKPQIISVIASHSNDSNYGNGSGHGNKLVPFRIDYFMNKGHEDKLCCHGVSICCSCNALGQLMKPIS